MTTETPSVNSCTSGCYNPIVVFLLFEAHGSAAHRLSGMAMWSSQPIIHQQTAKVVTVPTIVYTFDTYSVPIISEHIEYIGI